MQYFSCQLISRLEEFQSHFRKFHDCSDAGSCKDDINGDDDRADTRPGLQAD